MAAVVSGQEAAPLCLSLIAIVRNGMGLHRPRQAQFRPNTASTHLPRLPVGNHGHPNHQESSAAGGGSTCGCVRAYSVSAERTKVTMGTDISQPFCYAEPGFWTRRSSYLANPKPKIDLLPQARKPRVCHLRQDRCRGFKRIGRHICRAGQT